MESVRDVHQGKKATYPAAQLAVVAFSGFEVEAK